jgi:hypothetical protein
MPPLSSAELMAMALSAAFLWARHRPSGLVAIVEDLWHGLGAARLMSTL